MSTPAEISSLSSTLEELHHRVTAMAEGALARGDEDMAHELIAVERSLGARSDGCAASGRARAGAEPAQPAQPVGAAPTNVRPIPPSEPR